MRQLALLKDASWPMEAVVRRIQFGSTRCDTLTLLPDNNIPHTMWTTHVISNKYGMAGAAIHQFRLCGDRLEPRSCDLISLLLEVETEGRSIITYKRP